MNAFTTTPSRLIVLTAVVLSWVMMGARAAGAAEVAGAGATVLRSLAGSWRGTGRVTGLDSSIEMTWEPVLAARFTRLAFKNTMTAPDKPPRVFEGNAYYRATGGDSLAGTWFDSRGLVLPITSRATATSIESDWGSADTERGRTIYRLIGVDSLVVIDSVRTPSGMREFGRSGLRRH